MADQTTGTGQRLGRAKEQTADGSARTAAPEAVRRAREAVAREAWAEAYHLLNGMDPTRLAPDDCAALADAAWWTSRVEGSITARMRAYSGYAAAGADRQAGYCAWMLFYEHRLAGRTAVAAGWLRRARQHLQDRPECAEQCYLAWMEAEAAQERGAFEEAMASARRMAGIARRCGKRRPVRHEHPGAGGHPAGPGAGRRRARPAGRRDVFGDGRRAQRATWPRPRRRTTKHTDSAVTRSPDSPCCASRRAKPMPRPPRCGSPS